MERNWVHKEPDTWKFDVSTYRKKWREVMFKSYIAQQRISFRTFGLNHYRALSSKHIVILLWVLLLATWLNTNANIDKWKHNITRESLLPISVTEKGSKEECVGNVAILLYFMCIFTRIFFIFLLHYTCTNLYMFIIVYTIYTSWRFILLGGRNNRSAYRWCLIDRSLISASLFCLSWINSRDSVDAHICFPTKQF